MTTQKKKKMSNTDESKTKFKKHRHLQVTTNKTRNIISSGINQFIKKKKKKKSIPTTTLKRTYHFKDCMLKV